MVHYIVHYIVHYMARYMVAPCEAKVLAALRPRPPLPPVMSTVRPAIDCAAGVAGGRHSSGPSHKRVTIAHAIRLASLRGKRVEGDNRTRD